MRTGRVSIAASLAFSLDLFFYWSSQLWLWRVSRHFYVCVFVFLCLSFLSVEVESGAVLPSRSLNANPTRRNPSSPGAVLSGSHHYYDDPTPDIPACLVVGFPPQSGEADVQALHNGLYLCAQYAVKIKDKRGKWHRCCIQESR